MKALNLAIPLRPLDGKANEKRFLSLYFGAGRSSRFRPIGS